MDLWKLFGNTKCRSFDSSYEIVPMKQSRTWQLCCSEAEMSKESFPRNKNIPTSNEDKREWKRREGKKMNQHYHNENEKGNFILKGKRN